MGLSVQRQSTAAALAQSAAPETQENRWNCQSSSAPFYCHCSKDACELSTCKWSGSFQEIRQKSILLTLYDVVPAVLHVQICFRIPPASSASSRILNKNSTAQQMLGKCWSDVFCEQRKGRRWMTDENVLQETQDGHPDAEHGRTGEAGGRPRLPAASLHGHRPDAASSAEVRTHPL